MGISSILFYDKNKDAGDAKQAGRIRKSIRVKKKTLTLIYPFILKKAIFSLLRSVGFTRECSRRKSAVMVTIPPQ